MEKASSFRKKMHLCFLSEKNTVTCADFKAPQTNAVLLFFSGNR